MLNWYRALRRFTPDQTETRIHQPVLILWGEKDRFLDRGLAEASAALCDRAEIRFFPSATHWLHHEEPEAVNEALVAFFKAP
jgi:pimeloyl-ACP methyl ester carboxylesterase